MFNNILKAKRLTALRVDIRMFLLRSGAGFTLLEILVIIAIIGIAANFAIVYVQKGREDARLAGAKQFSRSILNALGSEAQLGWTFESINGNVVTDSFGGNNSGTIGGNPTVVSGIIGTALNFDGTDDAVEAELATAWSGNFTVSFWVKANSVTQTEGAGLFASADKVGATGFFQIVFDRGGDCDSKYRFDGRVTSGGGSFFHVCFGPITSDWHHLAVTFDRNTKIVTTYYDGRMVSSAENSSFGGLFEWYILGHNIHPSDKIYFKGVIDELYIFKQALSLAEIQKMYAEGVELKKVAERPVRY